MEIPLSRASLVVLLCSLFIASFVFLSGCTNPAPPAPPNPYLPSEGASLSQSHNAFGFNLFSKILASESGKDKNIMVSPTSIHLALSMVYAGSAGAAQGEMGKTLQIGNAGPDSLNQGSKSLISSLSGRKDVDLSVANSLWLNTARGFQFKQDYQNGMETYYSAATQALDFNDEPASADRINGWVAEKTRDKITSIVQPDELPDYEAVLLNAVYFKGKWAEPFDKKLTQAKAFTARGGMQLQIPMMKQSGYYSYFEENGILGNHELQAIKLPYGNKSNSNERMNMYVFLPSDIGSFTQKMDGSMWNELKGKFSSREGTILLPKFKYDYEKDLIPQLKELGMLTAFSDAADFSKMSATPLKIGVVRHKTFIETNEEGSEAAAVTAVGMIATSAAPNDDQPKPFYMEVNRPFFYAIVDENSGEILFMGVVNNPSP